MKFALSVLALSGAAVGSSILERQVSTIIGVVNGIEKATAALDTAVQGFSGDATQLLSASSALGDTVTKGVATVKGASSITLTDSVSIQGQVSNLQQTVESVVNDLISKKDALVSAGQGAAVEKNLQDQLSGAQALQAAISSKVPPEVQSLAQQLSAGINTSLQKGVDAFAGTGGSTSTTGSSGSSGMSGMADMPGMSGSSSSSSSSAVFTSAVPKPATFTGAAPRAVAGSLAGVVAIFTAVVFVL